MNDAVLVLLGLIVVILCGMAGALLADPSRRVRGFVIGLLILPAVGLVILLIGGFLRLLYVFFEQ